MILGEVAYYAEWLLAAGCSLVSPMAGGGAPAVVLAAAACFGR